MADFLGHRSYIFCVLCTAHHLIDFDLTIEYLTPIECDANVSVGEECNQSGILEAVAVSFGDESDK